MDDYFIIWAAYKFGVVPRHKSAEICTLHILHKNGIDCPIVRIGKRRKKFTVGLWQRCFLKTLEATICLHDTKGFGMANRTGVIYFAVDMYTRVGQSRHVKCHTCC